MTVAMSHITFAILMMLKVSMVIVDLPAPERCHFPFRYNKQEYTDCTDKDGKRLWCSTTYDYNRDKKWRYCDNPPKNTAVLVSPSAVITKGSSVTLTCSSDANPAVESYTWFKVDQSTPVGSGQQHSISNISSEDGGQYYCEARNGYGAENASAVSITVEGEQGPVTVAVVAVLVCAVVCFLCVVLWLRYQMNRNLTNEQMNRPTSRGRDEQAAHDYENDDIQTNSAHQNLNPNTSQPDADYQNMNPNNTQPDADYQNMNPNTTQPDAVYQSLDPNTTQPDAVYQSLNPNTTQPDAVYQSLNHNTTQPDAVYQSLNPNTTQPDAVYQSLNPNTIQPDADYQSLNPNTSQHVVAQVYNPQGI
ncbi:hypothetical protein ACEWY4_017334 [Coilia grayii]|uniref:B-cell receptor CD22 n=1 Tax=Coilia grayii TaxID=363190 RepID=A0ABD1JHZ4_9TELE